MGAWQRGSGTPDDVLSSLGEDLHHVVIGLDPERPLGPAEALGVLRRSGGPCAVALTAPGDPAGLAGPVAFNALVMEAGEAVLFPAAGLGLVPVQVGGAVEWRATAAHTPPILDPREARQHLHMVLREVTEELADLHIATWNNEIPDLLLNRADPPPIPRDIPATEARTLTTAALCCAIVDAAASVEPGAVTAWERSRLEACMHRLDRAARHALVALCSADYAVTSDSLGSP